MRYYINYTNKLFGGTSDSINLSYITQVSNFNPIKLLTQTGEQTNYQFNWSIDQIYNKFPEQDNHEALQSSFRINSDSTKAIILRMLISEQDFFLVIVKFGTQIKVGYITYGIQLQPLNLFSINDNIERLRRSNAEESARKIMAIINEKLTENKQGKKIN